MHSYANNSEICKNFRKHHYAFSELSIYGSPSTNVHTNIQIMFGFRNIIFHSLISMNREVPLFPSPMVIYVVMIFCEFNFIIIFFKKY